MWPFTNRSRFPNIIERRNGSIRFRHTIEESTAIRVEIEAHGYRHTYSGDDASEQRCKIVATALYKWASHLSDLTENKHEQSLYRANPCILERDLRFAVASSWKAYTYFPFPILLYQRANLMRRLGIGESQELMEYFYLIQRNRRPDAFEQMYLVPAGANIEAALSHAIEQIPLTLKLVAC